MSTLELDVELQDFCILTFLCCQGWSVRSVIHCCYQVYSFPCRQRIIFNTHYSCIQNTSIKSGRRTFTVQERRMCAVVNMLHKSMSNIYIAKPRSGSRVTLCCSEFCNSIIQVHYSSTKLQKYAKRVLIPRKSDCVATILITKQK